MSDTASALTAETTGRWLITTERSSYIWDCDAETLTRQPLTGEASHIDGQPLALAYVEQWPTVGAGIYAWFRDPFDLSRRWLRSSAVISIEKLA